MDMKRGEQILCAGIKAAQKRIVAYPKRPEYPRDFNILYTWLEDKLFNLYEAIHLKKFSHVREMTGEIIVTASEIAELANSMVEWEELFMRVKEDEISDN